MAEPFKFDSLNTSYLSLAALIRYLRENDFTGRLHIALDHYEADVFLNGSQTLNVTELDLATGREAQGEGAMQRLLVRAREPGGVITLYEADVKPGAAPSGNSDAVENNKQLNADESVTVDDLSRVVAVSAKLINAVELAVESAGVSFAELFQMARIEIGDDYPFLDPTVGGFEYDNSQVNLQSTPVVAAYVQGVSEALNRVVNRVAQQRGENNVRERVALELTILARRQPNALAQFTSQLDRIAGTAVLRKT